jgi:hypothetical protein
MLGRSGSARARLSSRLINRELEPLRMKALVNKPCIFILGSLLLTIIGSVPSSRAAIRPLNEQERAELKLSSACSGGVFVGISQFEGDSGAPKLQFAVDDAVALAHLFALRLELIHPKNTTLLLGGQVSTPASRLLLEELQKAGITPQPAGKIQILKALSNLKNKLNQQDALAVVAFSTHGYEASSDFYLMAEDSYVTLIKDTGVSIATVKSLLSSGAANCKLLIVDACRETAKSTTGTTQTTFDLLKRPEGMGVLISCSAGQRSYESPELEHGAFAGHLISAFAQNHLTGRPQDGRINIRDVQEYISLRIKAANTPDKDQTPYYEGPSEISYLALAVDQDQYLHSLARKERIKAAAGKLDSAYRKFDQQLTLAMKQSVEVALETWTGRKLESLLEQIDNQCANPTQATVTAFVAWWTTEKTSPAVPIVTNPPPTTGGPPPSGSTKSNSTPPGPIKPSIRVEVTRIMSPATASWNDLESSALERYLVEELNKLNVYGSIERTTLPPAQRRGRATKPTEPESSENSTGKVDYILKVYVDAFQLTRPKLLEKSNIPGQRSFEYARQCSVSGYFEKMTGESNQIIIKESFVENHSENNIADAVPKAIRGIKDPLVPALKNVARQITGKLTS